MSKKLSKNWITLLILALAGGLVFKIPYLKYSYYDALIEALQIDDIQLGVLTSSFGIASMVCYFPGGWVADKFKAKNLLCFSFIAQGLLGLIYSTFPNYNIVLLIHIAYGAVVCLTYWSVAIKAVRLLATGEDIGKMFGFWEGGKQISGLIISYTALAIFARFDVERIGMTWILIIYSSILISIGILLLFLLKNVESTEKSAISLKDMFTISKEPKAWIFGLMVFTAYHFHIGMNLITPYLTRLFNVSSTKASGISMFMLYVVGFFGAAVAGTLVDKFKSTLKVVTYMLVLAVLSLVLYLIVPVNINFTFIIITLWGLAQFSNFAIRGVYFSSLGEIGVPKERTGLFIGFASFIGFIPDTYFHMLTGFFLGKYPGQFGFKLCFIYMLVMTVLCLLVVSYLKNKYKIEN
ncbi:MFS transporter [Fusobacterium perfoetens]|uniref:MFS transporter n=1 Tax=Fusobacterium perfoetens TaxID=852 RepID=UPI000484FB1C|nr:MFS transporter [Fusobacterium perfoetens]MCI6152659.1 MFS transporter [Fusobacterium perfoetens]MDY3237689.1 MFS transporter [Fusobacterium perfoetens]